MAGSNHGQVETSGDMNAHKETYDNFINIVVAGILACIIIMIALAAVGFGSTASAVIAVLGMTVSLIVIFISLLAGMSFLPSVVVIAGTTLLALIL